MKIFYITNARIPTEKAHGHQITKMCNIFAKLGHSVQLILPKRSNRIKDNIFNFYNINNNFSIRFLWSIDFLIFNKLLFGRAYYFQNIFYIFRLLFLNIDKKAIVYTRTPEIAWLFSKKGYKVLFEAHYWPLSKTNFYKKMIQGVNGIICNSKGTLERHKKEGLNNLFLAPNGVDLDNFDSINKTKEDLRHELSLPVDKKILMYLGHLYPWKGVDLLVDFSDKLKNNKDFLLVIVGGTDKDIEKYRKLSKKRKLENIIFLGRFSKSLVPKYLKSADLLFLPNVAISDESINYTSPIKMFEYMAAKIPILASNLPSIKEILNNNNSFLFEAGNIIDMEENLYNIFEDYEEALRRAKQAYNDVNFFTWNKRAIKIQNRFIK